MKLGPWGWLTTSGLNPGRAGLAAPLSVVLTGSTPESVTSTTCMLFMSTVATMPSIGRSYGFGSAPR